MGDTNEYENCEVEMSEMQPRVGSAPGRGEDLPEVQVRLLEQRAETQETGGER